MVTQIEGKSYKLVECAAVAPPVDPASVPERKSYVMFEGYRDVMSREEAAEALGMNVKDLGELLMAGDIRAYRDGRRWRVPKASLIEYVENRLKRGWYE